MFYKVRVKDHIRIPPEKFKLEIEDAMTDEISKKFEGYISQDLGTVIEVSKIVDIKDGIIIPGDGAAFYETEFILLTFIPELQEVVLGTVKDIADFGAFMTIGPAEGMIHISQTMNDFVSFSKEKVLVGKDNKKNLKVGDKCRARIISVSYKDSSNPKIGLTMRQDGLGKEDWLIVPVAVEAKPKAEKPKKK
jgi:DNA-directed RNA polymerase subunit E'